MKTLFSLAFGCAVALGLAPGVCGQGTFRNLGFEQANIIPILGAPYYPSEVEISDAMPGWTAYDNAFGSHILYDNYTLAAPAVSIHDGLGPFSISTILQGRYTAYLQEYFISGTIRAAIGQSGTIPLNAQSVRFYATGPLELSFGGQMLPIFALGTGPNYTIYGANILPFEGQSGELLFRVPAGYPPDGYGTALDNISFSSQPAPEPGVIALLTLGALLLGGALRHRRTT